MLSAITNLRPLMRGCAISFLGAIYSCLSAFATMFPNAKFLMFFIVPMPAWAAVGGIFAVSAIKAVAGTLLTDGSLRSMIFGRRSNRL